MNKKTPRANSTTYSKKQRKQSGETTEGRALMKGLGKAIKDARLAKGLGQVQVSDSGNLSRLETGQQWASPGRLAELSRILDTPIWALFARAEGALDSPIWELFEAYQNADAEGRALLEHAKKVANKYHRREKNPLTVIPTRGYR